VSWLGRLRNRWRERALSEDFDAELRFHLDARIDANLARGLSPTDASREARRHFGNVVRAHEDMRDARIVGWLDELTRTVSLACRSLWHTKTFTITAVLVLALGIAGTTVMFTLIHGVLLRPLPVRDEHRLIVVWKQTPSLDSVHYPFGDTEIEEVARTSQLLEATAGVTRNGVGRWVLVEKGVASYANVALVTGRFFDVLGTRPLLGRTLSAADDKDGTENVIVLSRRLWQRLYHASTDVVGRQVSLGGRPFTIVGVMPADVDYPSGVEVWTTTASVPRDAPFADAARSEVNLVARLRTGVTVAQATSELRALTEQLNARAPAGSVSGLVPVVRSFVDVVVGEVRTSLVVLFGAVGLMLLIAGANVANLLLMRGEARGRELALRAALGAGRGRIVSMVLAESLILAATAGVVGLSVAWVSLQTLVTLMPEVLPRVEAVRIDATVVAFSMGLVLATAILASAAPARLWMSPDLLSLLQSGGRGTTGSRAARGRRALVVAQVALAVTIVVAAGLLSQSLRRLQSVDFGLPVDRFALVELDLPRETYAEPTRHVQLLDTLTSRLEATQVISAATPVHLSPFSGQGGMCRGLRLKASVLNRRP
jgi:predicted permease